MIVRSHTFEQTFAARIAHLMQIALASAVSISVGIAIGIQLDTSAWVTAPLSVLDDLIPKTDHQFLPKPPSSY